MIFLLKRVMKTAIKRTVLSQIPFPIRHQFHVFKHREKYREIRTQESDHLFNAFDKHKCLFVHIPKTGGVSVYRSLFSPTPDKVIKSIGHYSLKDYGVIFGSDALEEYFKFAFVRNPWARTLSSYQFLKKGGFHNQDKAWADANIDKFNSFDEFVIEWLTPGNISKALHFIPQHEFLTIARGGENSMDFVGKLETIESDFQHIKNQLDIDCNLQHHNKSKSTKPKAHYRNFYTQKSRDIVARVYQKDIDTFNYTF